jgi:hypothetical protein
MFPQLLIIPTLGVQFVLLGYALSDAAVQAGGGNVDQHGPWDSLGGLLAGASLMGLFTRPSITHTYFVHYAVAFGQGFVCLVYTRVLATSQAYVNSFAAMSMYLGVRAIAVLVSMTMCQFRNPKAALS